MTGRGASSWGTNEADHKGSGWRLAGAAAGDEREAVGDELERCPRPMPYGHRRGEDPRRYPVHAAVYDGDARKLATTLLAKHARGGAALADALAEQDADGGGEGLGLQTPLQRAVRSKKPGAAYEGVRRLIAAGAEGDEPAMIARAAGGHGSTALHIYAFRAAHDDAKVAQLLVAAGCDPRATDSHGHTAAWVADECGHPRIAEALRQAEAAGGAPATSSSACAKRSTPGPHRQHRDLSRTC